MRKALNQAKVVGKIFSHKLVEREVTRKDSPKFGEHYISGVVNVAMDDDGLNIVPVNFSFVSPKTNAGATNRTYAALSAIMNDDSCTWANGGKDNAKVIDISCSFSQNDYVLPNEEDVREDNRIAGSFASMPTVYRESDDNNSFTVDALLVGAKLVEADEERQIPNDYLVLDGYVFDYLKNLVSVKFIVKDEGGIQYFQSLDISKDNFVFSKIWGNFNYAPKTVIVKEDSAFGVPRVKKDERKVREYIVTGANPELYSVDEVSTDLTYDELRKAKSDREIHLAEVVSAAKERAEAANNKGGFAAPKAPAMEISKKDFKF